MYVLFQIIIIYCSSFNIYVITFVFRNDANRMGGEKVGVICAKFRGIRIELFKFWILIPTSIWSDGLSDCAEVDIRRDKLIEHLQWWMQSCICDCVQRGIDKFSHIDRTPQSVLTWELGTLKCPSCTIASQSWTRLIRLRTDFNLIAENFSSGHSRVWGRCEVENRIHNFYLLFLQCGWTVFLEDFRTDCVYNFVVDEGIQRAGEAVTSVRGEFLSSLWSQQGDLTCESQHLMNTVSQCWGVSNLVKLR